MNDQRWPVGTGNWRAKAFISLLNLATSALLPSYYFNASLKSFSLVPLAFLLIALTISTYRSTNFIISTKSASLAPRVVMAGAPILIPDGTKALLSPGTVFLLIVREISFAKASNRPPSVFLELRSTVKRWLSVPPDTTLYPLSIRVWQAALLFFKIYINDKLPDFDIPWTQESKLLPKLQWYLQ